MTACGHAKTLADKMLYSLQKLGRRAILQHGKDPEQKFLKIKKKSEN